MKDSYSKAKNEKLTGLARWVQLDWYTKFLTDEQRTKYAHIVGTHGHDFAVCYGNSVREREEQHEHV